MIDFSFHEAVLCRDLPYRTLRLLVAFSFLINLMPGFSTCRLPIIFLRFSMSRAGFRPNHIDHWINGASCP